MPAWLEHLRPWFYWLSLASIASLVLAVVLLPLLLGRLPVDYFTAPRQPPPPAHPVARLARQVIRNVVGAFVLAAGVAMLVLPGQGLLTILAGLTLLDFPAKYRVERWLVGKPAVLKAVNWLRARAKQPPLRPPLPTDPAA